ncbi:hypothetical protein VMCG_10455 [Cytospora schulzeri]|uniref:Peptidase S8/S53 domain-containing protein n=1 Tax=Cytospora schulzeri TaxID=448051 RepID=A0A423VBY5_9PEZI|nr:hypothetical protein VMCG_10455 [Valsa malicola]
MAPLVQTLLTTLSFAPALLSILAGQVNGAPAPAPASEALRSTSAGLAVPILNPDARNIIPSKYIVVYHDTIDDDTVAAHQAYWATTIAKRNIGKRSLVDNRLLSPTVRTFSIGALRAMALEADDASAMEINNADEVHYIEAETQIHLSNTVIQHNATSGLARLSSSQPGATSYTYHDSAGAGITVFVVDTGIMADHEDFEGRAFLAFNSVDGNNTDGNGHGSHVAGTIGGKTFGVAKKVTLYGVKVLGADGTGPMSSVLTGVEFVAQTVKQLGLSGKSVMNLSLDGSLSNALNQAINNLRAAGVVPVVAAGNDNDDAQNNSPASAAGAVTVGAVDQTTDQKASFSNFGQLVDVFAPGVNVESVSIQNTTATRAMSGTSMASPHVAGLAAYLMALENITNVDAVAARIRGLAGATGSHVLDNVKGTTPLIANNGLQAGA